MGFSVSSSARAFKFLRSDERLPLKYEMKPAKPAKK
jgi:hypothetical protein